MWETWVRSLGWEDPLEKEMTTQDKQVNIHKNRKARMITAGRGEEGMAEFKMELL